MARTLSAAFRTIVLVPLFFVYTIFKAGYVIWVGKRNRESPKIEQTIQTWARQFLRIPPVEIEVEGREHVDPDQRYVVVSNHISNFDIPVLFRSIPTPIRFLAKKELYKIPLLGPGMDTAGIVKVDRGGARSTREAVNTAARETYRRGYSLMVFAEGTRSRTGEMADFHTGAVRIARDNEADLLPVVISGSFDINPPGSKLIYPGRARVRILPPVPSANIEPDQIRSVTDQMRKDMGEVYEDLRKQ
ncbi:MAG: lysophospholipid acyltransferase family protein [Actinomycetota bacterium]|nr:lysophospholipid acyltransferase family protein [Actinomycetota bacterium]